MSDISASLPAAAAAALSAGDRAGLVNALKHKLQNLSGEHSDVLESLTPAVRKRVEVLQGIQIAELQKGQKTAMRSISASPLYLPFFLFLLFSSLFNRPTFATKRSYVVYLGAHSHSSQLFPDDLNRVRDSHYEFLGSCLGSKEKAKDAIFYSYTRHINGFATILEDDEAIQIAKHPTVVSVFLNKGRKLHMTRSWDFMGLENNGLISSSSIWKKARFGEKA